MDLPCSIAVTEAPFPRWQVMTFVFSGERIRNSIARAAIFKDAVIAPVGRPRVDVVAAAKIDMAPGDVIDGLGGYKTYGLAENYSESRRLALLPIGLAEGCCLKRPVVKDAVLTYEDVERPAGRLIDRLRAEQDRLFPA